MMSRPTPAVGAYLRLPPRACGRSALPGVRFQDAEGHRKAALRQTPTPAFTRWGRDAVRARVLRQISESISLSLPGKPALASVQAIQTAEVRDGEEGE